MGERVSQIEDKMGKYADFFYTLLDTNAVHEDDLQWLKAKVPDLVVRSHSNIKICGIPESVQLAKLTHYVQDLFKSVAPSPMPEDLTIYRIHRIPKPAYLPQAVPHDVLLRILFFRLRKRSFLLSNKLTSFQIGSPSCKCSLTCRNIPCRDVITS